MKDTRTLKIHDAEVVNISGRYGSGDDTRELHLRVYLQEPGSDWDKTNLYHVVATMYVYPERREAFGADTWHVRDLWEDATRAARDLPRIVKLLPDPTALPFRYDRHNLDVSPSHLQHGDTNDEAPAWIKKTWDALEDWRTWYRVTAAQAIVWNAARDEEYRQANAAAMADILDEALQ